MNRKKRHHFRPRLHLRHFADATGRLWIHDRTGIVAPFRQTPENVGYENLLYTPEGGPDAGTDAFENWLADAIDSRAATPLAKAAAGRPLDRAERSSLAAFIAVQDLRTPRARDLVTALFHAGMQKEWSRWEQEPHSLAEAIKRDSGAEAIKRDSGVTYTPDEIRELLGEYSFQVTKDAWLDFAQ